MNDLNVLSSTDKRLNQNWERFLETGILPENQRSFIQSSWDRCKQHFVDPLKKKANIIYVDGALEDKKKQNQILLDSAKPLVEGIISIFFAAKSIYFIV